MRNAKTHFVMKKIAEGKLEIAESQPAKATAEQPSLVVPNANERI
jgi:hypothetical protein